MRHFLILILTLNVSLIFSQNEANIWYFGTNAGLDFSSGAPIPLFDGALNTNEGCATISNTNGELLFYTDGITVWNKNHAIMLNGTGLKGDSSSTQSAIIIPKPNNPDQYYIFTVDALDPEDISNDISLNNGIHYSELDMSLDAGLGGVTANKNILLHTPTTENLTAVKSANGNEVWVISHKWNSNQFIAYNVSATGVNTTPVISAVGSIVEDYSSSNPQFTKATGQLKASPDGTKLAVARGEGLSEAQLFNFDANSGVVSNPITLISFNPSNKGVYGIEFSSNSKVLYVSVVGVGVFQYNLQSGSPSAIINSQFQITTIPTGYAGLQLAVDGKIYVAKFSRQIIDVIDNPNILGAGCNYQFEHLNLNRFCRSGLPPFIQSFLQIEDIQFENTCVGDITTFSYASMVDSIVWNFGDAASGSNNTSTNPNATHIYSSPGTYNVTATVTIGNQTATATTLVTIHEQPIATQPQDLFICDTNNDGLYLFDLTTQNNSILNGQDATQFSVSYFESLTAYNNGNEISYPTNYQNSTSYSNQNIIAEVKNNDNGDCEAITNFNIQVFNQAFPETNIPNLEICDNTSFGSDTDGIVITDLTIYETLILNGQTLTEFDLHYYNNASLTNEILMPDSYQNTNSTETIFVKIENKNNSNCKTVIDFQLVIKELPTTNSIATLNQCDDDTDGFSAFNLNEAISTITNNAAIQTITFHETQLEAEDDLNNITNTTNYINQTVNSDTVWVRVESANNCFRVSQLNLVVTTTQIPTGFSRDFYKCDDGADTTDGIATFDFSSVSNDITALFPAGQSLNISYYKNQADALAEINEITNTTNYQNIGYPITQTIYIRVESAIINACIGLGQHITLYVETVPIANPINVPAQCDADGDGFFDFDTSNINSTILAGQSNVSIAYFDASGNTLPSPLPNPYTTETQTIIARVINTNSQDPNGACFAETQINFIVDGAVVANPVNSFTACDDNNDGSFSFDTSSIQSTILGTQTNVNIYYFDELGNALPSPLPSPFTTTTQTVTARVENILSSNCFDETPIHFNVFNTPIANPINNDFKCDDNTNDGAVTFTLSDYDSQILNGQSSSDFEVLYFDDLNNAQNNTGSLNNSYISNATSETIYARIQNINNLGCFDITSFEIGVSYLPIANQPNDLSICDDDTNDGIETFDLSIQNSTILNGLNSSNFSVSYYLSQSDANAGINTLSTIFTNTNNSQTIYARIENNNNSNCYTTTSFQLIVNEQPVLTLEDTYSICENASVFIQADLGYDNYLWSTGETTSGIMVFNSGTYTLTASNLYGTLICEVTKQIEVVESNIASIINIETEDWSATNNSIVVYVEGSGDYEYSIDGLNYQDSNTFYNLEFNDYTVYVNDKKGCGEAEKQVSLIFYPNFFTPNNDGYNDYWQLYNSDKEPNTSILIFDRYGKLLKQLNPTSKGWDGTFQGNPLPTNDYWFKVLRENGRTYTGNFTLKR